MARVLSEIAYLDTITVGELLEVVEGGLLLSYRRTRERTEDRKSSLRAVFSGLGGEHSRGSAQKDGDEGEYKTTPVGNLGRVFKVLDDRNLVSGVFGSDQVAWDGLAEGEFIECEVHTSVPPFHALLKYTDDLLGRLPQTGGAMVGVQAAQMAQLREQLETIKAWFSTDADLPVFLQPAQRVAETTN